MEYKVKYDDKSGAWRVGVYHDGRFSGYDPAIKVATVLQVQRIVRLNESCYESGYRPDVW